MIFIYIQIKFKTLVFFKNLAKTMGGLKESNFRLELLRPQAKKISIFLGHELGREACLGLRHPPYPEGTSQDPLQGVQWCQPPACLPERVDTNSIYEEIEDKQHTSEIYIVSNNDIFGDKTVEARNDAVRTDIKYSAGEKMMISISHDNENVYSDKLLIAVNEHDEVVNCEDSHEFDPDTLERNLDKKNELSRSELDVEDTSQEIQEVIVGKHFKTLFIHKVIQIYLYANHS